MGSVNSNFLPASTGLTLGSLNQQWTAYLSNVFPATISSQAFTPATAGFLRLASTDAIGWRNNANSGDVILSSTGAVANNVPADSLIFSGGGFVGDFISNSMNPSVGGAIHLSAADTINFRNQANSADVFGLQHNSDDTVTVGGSAGIKTSGNVAITGNETITGTLGVTGTSTLANVAVATSAISVTGAALTVSAVGTGGLGPNVSIVGGNGSSGMWAGGNILLTPGTGNAGAANGSIILGGIVSQVNGISTFGNGVPAEYATVDLVGQTAAITTTPLYTPAATGLFRVSSYLKITTTGTSPVIGPVTIAYTDGTDSVAQVVTMSCQTQAGVQQATGNAGNTTTSVLSGSLVIYAKVGVAINYAIALTGTVGAAAYEVHLRLEAL